jgi:hypothetical protein
MACFPFKIGMASVWSVGCIEMSETDQHRLNAFWCISPTSLILIDDSQPGTDLHQIPAIHFDLVAWVECGKSSKIAKSFITVSLFDSAD